MNYLLRVVEDEFVLQALGSDVTLAEMFTVTALTAIHTDRSQILEGSWKHVSMERQPNWLNRNEMREYHSTANT